MANRATNPLEHTSRLLDLVPFITAHQGISITELAQAFEVDTDQMVKDLTTLWMCGLPGYTPLELMDLDFESGFVSIKNAPTLSRPRSITHEEGIALLIGLEFLRNGLPGDREDLLRAISSLATKISQLINLPMSFKASSHIDAQVIAIIEEALRAQTGLEISYHSMYKDEITQRQIFPLELLNNDDNVELLAFCSLANDFRHFRVDRIQSVEPAEFEKPKEIKGAHSETIHFEISALSVSRQMAELFEISNLKRGESYSSTSFSKFWIVRSIFAAGGAAELLSPLDIRSEIAEKAKMIRNRYEE